VTTRQPRGLGYHGAKLWREMTAEFDLDADPHKRRILLDCCKIADLISELEKAAAKAPLVVRGSAQQQVINPVISEARFQRALLMQGLARLNFEGVTDATR
jgi:hypothetical protein